ncbi:MAG: dehydrogenase E1 component subunit alpha/beta [Oligoflexia bacterium]|nr:dehydrogenase E1 component subunit alpha/beta [Oligoflexia bacterium]
MVVARKLIPGANSASHSATKLRGLYQALLLPRMIEEKMLLLLRQGKVSKWFSGIGQEAISVGVTQALNPADYILPLHRNLGVFTSRGVPLDRLISQWQGTESGYTKGRDRSFHFGTKEHHIVGMISHLGPQLCVAGGIALAERLLDTGNIAAVFSGEGGTSEGDFHEALNVAAVWKSPVIFVVENNGYALSTPTQEQFCCRQIADRAQGYGIEGLTIDGNDLIEVFDTVTRLSASMRKEARPILLECMTFRMRGHEEASGVKYVPKDLIAAWAAKDPLKRFEQRLLQDRVISMEDVKQERTHCKQLIEEACERAFADKPVSVSSSVELSDVYASFTQAEVAPGAQTTRRRFVDAISDGLREGLRRHERLVFMGQDVAAYGGVFKVSEGFLDEFGPQRIRNTPLCESAILGAALGLSVRGMKAVVEMQFADFVSCGFNQIVNNLAKVHYRWGQAADVVVRMPTGAGTGAGPFHSQSNEAWFFKTPGLKIAYPAFPADAKGLLLSAIEDPNPVMFFEHKQLYRSVAEEVPNGYYTIPFGKARVCRHGGAATVVAYGAAVHWALEAQAQHPEWDLEIIDLRTLAPIDWESIRSSVSKTSRAIVVHEDSLLGGVGAEVAAWIGENCFACLDCPVLRVGSLDTPVPFNSALEANFLGKSRLVQAIQNLLAF